MIKKSPNKPRDYKKLSDPHEVATYEEPLYQGSFTDPYGGKQWYRGKGRNSDRSIDTWEDRRQDAYLRKLESSRKK